MTGEFRIIRETRLDPRFPLSRHELDEVGGSIMDSLGLEEHTVTLKLVSDAEIARLNKEFLGCTGPTNILSFPAGDETDDPDGHSGAGYLGELALSVDALVRESALYGQPPLGHMARLLAHGLLHLAGYDHGDEMYDLTDAAVDRVLLEYPEPFEEGADVESKSH